MVPETRYNPPVGWKQERKIKRKARLSRKIQQFPQAVEGFIKRLMREKEFNLISFQRAPNVKSQWEKEQMSGVLDGLLCENQSFYKCPDPPPTHLIIIIVDNISVKYFTSQVLCGLRYKSLLCHTEKCISFKYLNI